MVFKKRVEDRSICEDLNLLGKVWQGNIKYTRALERARLYTRQGFERCERPYIAISGGKDSVAMLAIVSEVWRNEYPTKDFTACLDARADADRIAVQVENHQFAVALRRDIGLVVALERHRQRIRSARRAGL